MFRIQRLISPTMRKRKKLSENEVVLERQRQRWKEERNMGFVEKQMGKKTHAEVSEIGVVGQEKRDTENKKSPFLLTYFSISQRLGFLSLYHPLLGGSLFFGSERECVTVK